MVLPIELSDPHDWGYTVVEWGRSTTETTTSTAETTTSMGPSKVAERFDTEKEIKVWKTGTT